MKSIGTAFALAMGLSGTSSLPSQAPLQQAFAIKGCNSPTAPIGRMIAGSGTVVFRLAKDGKPEHSAPTITSVTGVSVAALLSVATRSIGGCRFDVPKGTLSTPVLVRAELTVGPNGIAFGPAEVMVGGAPLVVEQFNPLIDTAAFAFDDPRLEERPAPLAGSCRGSGPSMPTTVRASGATPADAKENGRQQIVDASRQWDATHAGSISALVRVGRDGKVGSQVRVLQTSNQAATQALGDLIGSCKYVPGRVLGIAVPAMLVVQMTMAGRELHFVP